MGTMGPRVGMFVLRTLTVLAVVVVAVVTMTFSSGGVLHVPAELPPETTASEPTPQPLAGSEDIITIALQTCAETLAVGNCHDYPVTVEDLDGNVAAQTVGEVTRTVGRDSYSSAVRAKKVVLDPSLRDEHPQYVKHVAAHEWNHVEQYLVTGTAEKYEALQANANRYFADIASAPLQGADGLELLTDCMTALGDGVEMGPLRPGLTAYVETLTDARSMDEACGTGWQALLER